MKAVIITSFVLFIASVISLPVVPEDDSSFQNESVEITNVTNSTNTTIPRDLYVIRTYVYEVGILTDARNDTEVNQEDEEVDLSFFNPPHNGSLIDLNNIPVPIQTNVSGITLTGILPINFGAFDLNEKKESNSSITIPNFTVSVKQNISTSSSEKAQDILKTLSPFLNITNN